MQSIQENLAASPVAAIIVAAGQGARMGGIDKLFTLLGGQPLLAHTLAPFQACTRIDTIALVLAPDNLERGRQLVAHYRFTKVSAICPGGPRRQDSVRCGLATLGPPGRAGCHWLVVHDGARPLVTTDLIERALSEAAATGAAVPALPISDTVKEANPQGFILRTLDRRRLWAIQTPQAFRYDLLRRAHEEVTADVTDDAAMLEALGLPVKLFPGSPLNLKVTTAKDLRLTEALLQARASTPS